jgi:hypothetical protein
MVSTIRTVIADVQAEGECGSGDDQNSLGRCA